MSCVFPGVAEVLHRPLRTVSMLIREDLPTLERLMNANWAGPQPGICNGSCCYNKFRIADRIAGHQSNFKVTPA